MTAHGNDLFRKHAADWLTLQGLSREDDPLHVAITTGKLQILKDVSQRRVPANVSSFSQLHDYVDANYYGNAFFWPDMPSETGDDAYQEAFADFWNAVQNSLHDWIANGQMRNELTRGRGR